MKGEKNRYRKKGRREGGWKKEGTREGGRKGERPCLGKDCSK
jgi:hypothetical protein